MFSILPESSGLMLYVVNIVKDKRILSVWFLRGFNAITVSDRSQR